VRQPNRHQERSITVKTTIVVINAVPNKPGFGRIELAISRNTPAPTDYLEQNQQKRDLTAAAYCVAARLEQIGAGDGLEFDVSVADAKRGIIDVDFRPDAHTIDSDVITEILIEACGDCGFLPADAEVGS
jgi:hypothetical protein